MFKLLLGEEKYQGKIISSDKFIKFPPVITEEDYNNMGIELYYKHVMFAEDWKLFKELNMLGIDTELLYRPFKTLSHGQRIKILFAIFFLKEEGVLLIDEPTNHLDREGREILAKYLNKKKGYILISHDRRFLDNTIDHIISINNTDIEVQNGNFSSWYENYKRKEKDEQVENEKLKREIRKLKVAQENTKRWSDSVESSKYGKENSHADKGHIGHLAAKMMKTSKNIERRKDKAIEDSNILILGVSFKENCPDIRNTKVVDIYREFREFGANVDIYDNWVDSDELYNEYGVRTIPQIDKDKKYSAIVLVAHDNFKTINFEYYHKAGTVVFDVKSVVDRRFVDGRL